MNCSEINNYLRNVSKMGIVLGLDTMRELLYRLGNPEGKLKFIHVAGTNGKGSTIAYISSILNAAGFKTGTYTSPCVFSETEKYVISGKEITAAEYERLMTRIIAVCRDMKAQGHSHPTIFEMETAAAFYYFAEGCCDFAVIETGMGGREDATNVISGTKVCVLTSIDMDHMQYLGDTIEKIAYQKGGIIKDGSAVVLYDQNEKVNKVIKGICEEKNATLTLCDVRRAVDSAYFDENSNRLIFTYKRFKRLTTGLLGAYQAANAAVAVETVLALRKKGVNISARAIREGIKNTVICGRFEPIMQNPLFIIDGAHNPDAAAKLKQTVKMYFTNRKLVYIMGVLADKEFDKVAELMVPLADKVYTVTPDNKRALDAVKLAKCVSAYCKDVKAEDTFKQAVDDAIEAAGKDGVVIAFGSLSYIGSIKEIVNGQEKN